MVIAYRASYLLALGSAMGARGVLLAFRAPSNSLSIGFNPPAQTWVTRQPLAFIDKFDDPLGQTRAVIGLDAAQI
jgi:hypothetical protein